MNRKLGRREREQFEALRNRLEGVEKSKGETQAKPRPGPIDPMLASTFDGDLETVDESEFFAERKLDGTRIILQKFDDQVSLYTRRHVERSGTLVDLTRKAEDVLPDGLILDGEYTFLTQKGTSHFTPIHTANQSIKELNLEGLYFAFDILVVDGEWCTREPLERRRSILESTIPLEDPISMDEQREENFQAYYDELVGVGEEGIMLKRRSSPYNRGARSDHWRKVKAFPVTDVVIVGYTDGEGRRADTFGSLVMTDGERHIGRVGSGFSESQLEAISNSMTTIRDFPVSSGDVGETYTAVEPFVVQVKYQSVTDSGKLRAPVFLGLRPDKPIKDITGISD